MNETKTCETCGCFCWECGECCLYDVEAFADDKACANYIDKRNVKHGEDCND